MTAMPADIDPHLFSIRWIGGETLIIEQHRGILTFCDDTIRFLSEQGVLCVTGEALKMEHLTDSCASISGTIRSIAFEEES